MFEPTLCWSLLGVLYNIHLFEVYVNPYISHYLS